MRHWISGFVVAATVACTPPDAQRPLSSLPLGGGDAKSPVNLVETEGKPLIATLVRDGDPVPALSVALYADGDTAALVALAEVLSNRLADAGLSVESRVDRDALFLDVALPDDAHKLVAVRAALAAPITPVAGVSARVAERVAAIMIDSGPAVSAVRACSGQLGLGKASPIDPGSAAGAQRIEKLRQAAFATDRVAFGVVGPAPAVEGAVRALLEGVAWPAPAAAEAPDWQPSTSGASLAPGVASGNVRVSIAVQASDPAAAIAAAARLGRAPSPLGASAERSGFRLIRSSGVARPRGGCVSATFEGRLPAAGSDSDGRALGETLTALTRSAVREVELEIASGATPREAASRIALSADPREAAQLGAWWALSRPRDRARPAGQGVAAAVELAADQPETRRAATERALAAALETAKQSGLPAAPTMTARLERGQGETWVLVTNPCAPANEAPHRWGAAAFAALSAAPKAKAAARNLDPAITVEPVASTRGIGFVAHAAAKEGQDPVALARDLATAATASFFVPAPNGDDLLEAEGSALARLRAFYGPSAPGLAELGARMGEHPSVLEPLGLPLRLGRFEPLDLSRRLRATAEGPLVVAVLAQQDADKEGAAAAASVARWTGSASAAACPAVGPATAGRFEVREARKGPARVYWLFSIDASADARSMGRAFVTFVERERRPDGTRARLIEGRVSASLLLDLTAPDEGLETVERSATDWLRRLADGSIEDATIARALEAHNLASREALFDPRERLTRMSVGETLDSAAPVQAAELRRFMQKTLRLDRALMVVSRPE